MAEAHPTRIGYDHRTCDRPVIVERSIGGAQVADSPDFLVKGEMGVVPRYAGLQDCKSLIFNLPSNQRTRLEVVNPTP